MVRVLDAPPLSRIVIETLHGRPVMEGIAFIGNIPAVLVTVNRHGCGSSTAKQLFLIVLSLLVLYKQHV